MGKSDVRVRLSAEGQKEVIDAFKRVQAQAAKTGKDGGKNIGFLNKARGG